MRQNDIFPKGVEVVCSAIIEHEGKILLVKSPKWNNKWLMPGGHIEPGENINTAVMRETKEEVNLSIKPEKIITSGELIDSKDFIRPAHFIYFDVLCKTESTQVDLDGEELIEYKWVTPKEALGMDLAESYDRTIKDYVGFLESKK